MGLDLLLLGVAVMASIGWLAALALGRAAAKPVPSPIGGATRAPGGPHRRVA